MHSTLHSTTTTTHFSVHLERTLVFFFSVVNSPITQKRRGWVDDGRRRDPAERGLFYCPAGLRIRGGKGGAKRRVIVEIYLERERFVQVTTRQRESNEKKTQLILIIPRFSCCQSALCMCAFAFSTSTQALRVRSPSSLTYSVPATAANDAAHNHLLGSPLTTIHAFLSSTPKPDAHELLPSICCCRFATILCCSQKSMSR